MDPFFIAGTLGTIFLIIWIGVAGLHAINPYFAWQLTQKWKAKEEPSQSYFLIHRVIGIFFTLIGIGFFTFILTRRIR